MDNGFLRLTNVRIPRDQMLMKYTKVQSTIIVILMEYSILLWLRTVVLSCICSHFTDHVLVLHPCISLSLSLPPSLSLSLPPSLSPSLPLSLSPSLPLSLPPSLPPSLSPSLSLPPSLPLSLSLFLHAHRYSLMVLTSSLCQRRSRMVLWC